MGCFFGWVGCGLLFFWFMVFVLCYCYCEWRFWKGVWFVGFFVVDLHVLCFDEVFLRLLEDVVWGFCGVLVW